MSKHKIRKKGGRNLLLPSLIVISGATMLITFISNVIAYQKVNYLSQAQQASFYLTQELYGSNTEDSVSFNVHVKFNFDGCDGDITLYKDGTFIAGPNGWRGPGAFDYDQQYTASPVIIPNDGQPHAISYRGAVNRCPKSEGTLWGDINCTVTFDASGLPLVSPEDKCTIKNPQEILPVPVTIPKVIPSDVPPATETPLPTNVSVTDQSTPTPTIINNVFTPTPVPTVIIQFMGVKLGQLSGTQPLNIFWDFIKKIIGW